MNLRSMQDRIIVNAGDEKNIAAASPKGRLATATKIDNSKNPPRTP